MGHRVFAIAVPPASLGIFDIASVGHHKSYYGLEEAPYLAEQILVQGIHQHLHSNWQNPMQSCIPEQS
jgi:hypothetical protein